MSAVPLSVLGNSASLSNAPLASEASIPPASEGSMLLALTASMPPVRIRFSIKDNIILLCEFAGHEQPFARVSPASLSRSYSVNICASAVTILSLLT